MNDPYDQYIAHWIREHNREKIIHYLKQRYTVKIENYGHHINAYTSPGDEKPAFTITTDAAEEMSIDQLIEWLKTTPDAISDYTNALVEWLQKQGDA